MSRHARAFRLDALGCALCLAIGACSSGDGSSRGEGRYPDLPEPMALETMDRSVREQYAELRGTLDRLRRTADPEPAWLAEAYGKLGMWGQTYRDEALARHAYTTAQRLAPDDPRWPYYLGVRQAAGGDPKVARGAFERALELAPGDVAILIRLGELELELENYERAEELLQQVLRIAAEHSRARLGLGQIALARGDAALAVEHLEAALGAGEAHAAVHYPLGLAYRALGELDKAEKHLQKGIDGKKETGRVRLGVRDPMMAELSRMNVGERKFRKAARRSLKSGDSERALRQLHRAIAAEPNKPTPHVALARALARIGESEEALAEFDRALELGATASVHRDAGTYLSRLGDLDGAREQLRLAVAKDPKLWQAHRQLAFIAIWSDGTEKGLDESLSHLERAIGLRPHSAGMRLVRAKALMTFRRFDAATRALEEDLSIMPDDVPLRLLQARLLSTTPDDELRDGQGALELARGLAQEPYSATLAETFAMAYAALGDQERAVAWQKAALEAAGDFRWMKDRLERYEKGQRCLIPWRKREQDIDATVTPPDDPTPNVASG